MLTITTSFRQPETTYEIQPRIIRSGTQREDYPDNATNLTQF